MIARIVVAVIFVPLFILLIFNDNTIFYNAVVSVSLFMALLEYNGMIKKSGIRTFNWLNLLFLITLLYGLFKIRIFESNIIVLYRLFTVIIVYSILMTAFSLFTKDVKESLLRIVFTLFGAFYIVILGSSMFLIRSVGIYQTLFLFIVVWIYDSGAYFVGTALGRKKIMPLISPNKSLEGLIGGIVLSLVVVSVLRYTTNIIPFNNIIYLYFVTVVLCISAQTGDLLESLLKRFCGVKDSSNIIPGHGGILDKIDSFLIATPIFLLLSTL